MTRPPLCPGGQFKTGPYEVGAAIGEGGMGQVYRASDTNLKRDVAIKVLPDALAGDAERLARFQREAEVLARLNHPNIAHVYGLERSDGTTALVMELVEARGRPSRTVSPKVRFRWLKPCPSPACGEGPGTRSILPPGWTTLSLHGPRGSENGGPSGRCLCRLARFARRDSYDVEGADDRQVLGGLPSLRARRHALRAAVRSRARRSVRAAIAGESGPRSVVLRSGRELQDRRPERPGGGPAEVSRRAGGIVSPDGRWLAFASGDSGHSEVYVQPLGRQGATVQVSRGGGGRPVWAHDGRSLYYLVQRVVYQAGVHAGDTFASDLPIQLFSHDRDITSFDVTPDGKRFLLLRQPPSGFLPVQVIVNWRAKIGSTGGPAGVRQPGGMGDLNLEPAIGHDQWEVREGKPHKPHCGNQARANT